MKYNITIDKNIKVEDIIKLWLSVGWGKKEDYDEEEVREALRNTNAIIKAQNEKGELIGMARVLSDNKYHTVLADIIVHPKLQKKGIGTDIIKKLMNEYSHTTIYLDALPDNKKFFENMGFIKREEMTVYSIGAKK